MRYRRDRTPGGTFFFTVVTEERRPIFADPAMIDLLRSVVADVKRRRPFRIEAAVTLPDHMHTIWTLPEDDGDYPARWALIKSTFTRRCGLETGKRGNRQRRVWQRRYWEHRIRDDSDFNRHVDYIHWNPVKHGLVTEPEQWPWSSIHAFIRRGDIGALPPPGGSGARE